jgi:protease-4
VKDGLVLVFMLLFFALLFAALSQSYAAERREALPRPQGAIVEQPAEPTFDACVGAPGATRDTPARRRPCARHARRRPVKAVVLDLDSFSGGGQRVTMSRGGRPVGAPEAGRRLCDRL